MQDLQIPGVHLELSVASANLMRSDFRQIKPRLDRREFESPDAIAFKGQSVLRDYSAIDLNSIPLTTLKITRQGDGVIALLQTQVRNWRIDMKKFYACIIGYIRRDLLRELQSNATSRIDVTRGPKFFKRKRFYKSKLENLRFRDLIFSRARAQTRRHLKAPCFSRRQVRGR